MDSFHHHAVKTSVSPFPLRAHQSGTTIRTGSSEKERLSLDLDSWMQRVQCVYEEISTAWKFPELPSAVWCRRNCRHFPGQYFRVVHHCLRSNRCERISSEHLVSLLQGESLYTHTDTYEQKYICFCMYVFMHPPQMRFLSLLREFSTWVEWSCVPPRYCRPGSAGV